jgi:hypothetical protein
VSLRRYENWPALLSAYITNRMHEEFSWGKNDCVLFALDGVCAITGLDAAADIRGLYSSARGAARRMRDLYGHANLQKASAVFADKWGGSETGVMQAQRGDMVMHHSPDGPALGICTGRLFAAAGAAGVIWAPTRTAFKAWRV